MIFSLIPEATALYVFGTLNVMQLSGRFIGAVADEKSPPRPSTSPNA
jgi:hypothetical protein